MYKFEFEVVDHGTEHAQYFQGAGVSFTKFTEIATGAGSSAREAGQDALEIFWQTADKAKISVAQMEALEAQINALSEEEDAHEDCDVDLGAPHETCEWNHYVSIRWTYGKE